MGLTLFEFGYRVSINNRLSLLSFDHQRLQRRGRNDGLPVTLKRQSFPAGEECGGNGNGWLVSSRKSYLPRPFSSAHATCQERDFTPASRGHGVPLTKPYLLLPSRILICKSQPKVFGSVKWKAGFLGGLLASPILFALHSYIFRVESHSYSLNNQHFIWLYLENIMFIVNMHFYLSYGCQMEHVYTGISY